MELGCLVCIYCCIYIVLDLLGFKLSGGDFVKRFFYK